jgi:hypothetical protein
MVRWRLEHLPDEATTVLASAALLGREFGVETLLAISDRRDAVLGGLELAERAHFVRPVPGVPGRFVFAHALVMLALADELPSAVRLRMHERIAFLLARDSHASAPDVARHFREAAPLGHDAEALRWSRAAGDEAMARFAFASAAEQYAAALDIQLRVGVPAPGAGVALRVAHGRALRLAGDPAAMQLLVDAAVAAESAGEFTLMAEALLAVSLAYATEIANDTRLADLLRRALEQLPEPEGPTRARLLSFLAMETLHAIGREDPEALAGQALAMARRSGDPLAVANALVASLWTALHPAGVRERQSWAAELAELAGAHRLPFYACMAHTFMYMVMLEQGDAAAATAALDAAARTPGQSAGRWVIANFQATWTLLTAPLERAERESLAAVEIARDSGIEESVPFHVFGAQLVCIRMLQGRLGELDEPLTSFAASQALSVGWRAVLAWLRCSQGRAEEARHGLEDTKRLLADQSSRHYQWSSAVVLLANVACELGEHSACAEFFALLQPFSGLMTWNGACSFGPFDLILSRLATVLDRSADAERYARGAIALAERLGAQVYLAIARHRLATLLPPGGAQDRLESLARTGAERVGATLAVFG